MHQNRSKRQKREVNYFELNIGKSTPQPKPKGKSKPKKIDIVASLREPSETRLAAYQIQKERKSSHPGDVIGTIIKMEIKSEVKIELERVNTRHKYKNCKFPENVNYIHVDRTPCKSARKRANELPDLPPVEDTSQITYTNGLPVETSIRTDTSKISEHKEPNECAINSNHDNHGGLSVETSN